MGAEAADDARVHPWWASADPTVDALADEDPVAAYRAAKWPTAEPPPSDPPRSGPNPSDPPSGGPGSLPHDPAVCGRCPICMGLRRLGDQHPEVLEHLTEATRHLSAAVRTLLDQRTDPRPSGADTGATGADAGAPFERIDVDAPDEAGDPDDPGGPVARPS